MIYLWHAFGRRRHFSCAPSFVLVVSMFYHHGYCDSVERKATVWFHHLFWFLPFSLFLIESTRALDLSLYSVTVITTIRISAHSPYNFNNTIDLIALAMLLKALAIFE